MTRHARRASPLAPSAGPAQRARSRAALAALAAALACGAPEPPPHARVVSVAPAGAGVAPELAEVELAFSAPVAGEDVAAGGRIVLATAAALPDALAAVESESGAAGLPAAVPVSAAVEDGGRRVALRLPGPLRARMAYAVVISSRLRAADGRIVLDVDGRQRPTIARFETGDAAGPPPRPVVTEVRADAETPEAGGEYVELANLGEGPLELSGWRLAKRTATGALASCAVVPPDAPVPPGGIALVVGGAYDGRYPVPAEAAIAGCGTAALLGGLANDRPPEVLLLDPDGAVASSLGAGGVAPRCPAALVRIDPEGPDAAENLACAEGSPGAP